MEYNNSSAYFSSLCYTMPNQSDKNENQNVELLALFSMNRMHFWKPILNCLTLTYLQEMCSSQLIENNKCGKIIGNSATYR